MNVNLPDSFEVEMKLVDPIDSSTAAIGDSIRAAMGQNIKAGRDIVVPKGAEVSCRIAVLERVGNYYVLELQATSIDFEGGHANLRGRENSVTMMIFRNGRMVNANSALRADPRIFQTDHLRLSRGTGFILRSLLLKFKDNDSIRP
jgi:pSer/pThr/pTyr-binding forkhead associated (FHA) protein